MCGIYGILDYKNANLELRDLEKMGEAIKMRGPDDTGYYQDEKILLGHNRLSIIDLTRNGRQPLSNEDGSIWISFNGEIYNYLDIKSKLRQKHKFLSETDSEVIIHAYEEFGESLWERLEGMFALALWDIKKGFFYLVRDHFGIKPIFYTYSNHSFAFASQIKAILSLKNFKIEYDHQSLANYLSYFYIPGPETLIKNVHHLSPGHYIKYSNNSFDICQYYRLTTDLNWNFKENQLREAIPALIGDCVKSSMVSDVPIGLLLSGGMDSNILLSEMTRHYSQPIQTFTLKFDEPSYDEGSFAKMSSDKFKTVHYSETFNCENFDFMLSDIVSGMDCLNANPGLIMVYQFLRLASKNCKVALMGNGGDELFAGYATYNANNYLKFLKKFPEFLRRGLLGVTEFIPVNYNKYSTSYILKKFIEGSFFGPEKAHFYWRSIFNEYEKKLLMDPSIYSQEKIEMDASYKYLEKFNEAEGSFNDKALYADFKLFLGENGLIMADHLSMHFSMEVRPPLLVQKFVEFVFSIPFELKYFKGKSKSLLREAYKGRLPQKILNMKKHGTVCPLGLMFKTSLKSYVEEELGNSFSEKLPFFNSVYIKKIKDDHFLGKNDNGFKIWSLLCLGKWHQVFYDKRTK